MRSDEDPSVRLPFVTWIFAVVGVLFCVISAREFLQSRALARDGVVTTATVTNTSFRRHSKVIRYQFALGDRHYSAGDSLGRSDLWIPIPVTMWDRTSIGSPVAVRYLSEHPEINRPLESRSESSDDVAGFGVGIMSCGFAMILWRRLKAAS
jgi:hypothetical protein